MHPLTLLHIALITLGAFVGMGHALSVTTNELAPRQNSSDQALGTFCADPNQGGNCVIVDIKEAGACIDITTTLNPKVNGVSSFVPSNNGFCLMFTASQCSGDLWELGTSLLNFSLLTFDGISPDNAIFTVVCIQISS